jgi:hypothetical protein
MQSRWNIAIIVEALIWAAVILAASIALGDAPQAARVLLILGGGAAASIILLGGLRLRERRKG